MRSPERLPEEKAPEIKGIGKLGKMDTEKFSAEMRLAKKLALASLGLHSYSEKPAESMTLKELGAKLDQELPGIPL